ncbi:MAG: hypothetical protein AAB774_00265 [Patescibacteria group bacterium]
MLKGTVRFWQIRLNQLLNKTTGPDYLLVLLLVCFVYLIGRIWSHWTILSISTTILLLVNIGLYTSVFGLWILFLWRRLPYWAAIFLLAISVGWVSTYNPALVVITNINGPGIYSQLLTMLIGIGLLGTITALFELTKDYQPIRPRQFLTVFSRRQVFPSFTGMGNLVTMGVLRIGRDRFFIATLTFLIFTLVANGMGWFPIGNWLIILTSGMVILSIIISHRLTALSSSLLERFPGLPTTVGAIDFAVSIAGTLILAVISWALLFGLLQLNVVDTVWLTGIFLTGGIDALLISRSARLLDNYGLLGGWWMVILQLVALGMIYLFLWQLNLSGVLLVLGVNMALMVILTSYQESTESVTIKTSWLS